MKIVPRDPLSRGIRDTRCTTNKGGALQFCSFRMRPDHRPRLDSRP